MNDTGTSAHQRIARRVAEGRRNLTRELLTGGLLRVAAVGLAGFGLGTAVHLAGRIGSAPAWGLSLALLAVTGWILARALVRPLAGRPGRERFVEWLDARHDRDKNIIVSAWQLGADAEAGRRFAPDLLGAIAERGAAAADGVEVRGWRDTRFDRRWLGGLLAGAGLLLLLGLVVGPDRLGGAAGRLVDPRRAAIPPVTIRVEPGDRTVEPGDDVTLDITVSGGAGHVPALRVRDVGGAWMTRRLTDGAAPAGADPDGPVHYRNVLRRVERDQDYQVMVGKVESPTWRIRVNEAPRVAGFEITYYYPDYTKRQPETVTSGSGDLSALQGTRVLLKVLANRPMAAAVLITGPAGADSLITRESLTAGEPPNWETRLTLMGEPRDYAVVLRDDAGRDRFTSPRFRIEAAPDRPPVVRLVSPDRDMPIPESMTVPLVIDAVDDFGLSRVELVYEVKDKGDGRVRLKDLGGAPELHGEFDWDLVPLKLFPGNEVTYWVEVYDNDQVTGPKSGRSEVRHLRFPTMDELYTEVREENQEQIEDLSSTLDRSKELQKKLEELARDSRKNGQDLSWEKKKEMQDLLQKQSDLEKQLDETARKLEETLRKAQEETFISPELLEKMRDVADLMNSIKNEKLKESFQKLQDALDKMDPQALNQALEDFKLDQEQMMKSLDRTIEMLKEIQKEEMMEDSVRKAEELAREQQDQANQVQKEMQDGHKDAADEAKKNEKLADQQQELQKKSDELSRQLDELRKMAENEPKLKEDLDEMKQGGQPEKMKENMNQSEQQLRKGDQEKGLNFAFKASDDARKLAQQMRQTQASSNAAKKREMQEKLMAVIQDLVDVSSAQEDLVAQAAVTPDGELAARQRVLIEGTTKSALDLEALGKRTLFVNDEQKSRIGSALERMKKATQNYSQGQLNAGTREGKESAGDLNEAIVELMQSHSSMCSSGSPTGFMEQMQKMAGLSQQQQQLNDDAQAMSGQGGKPRLSREGSSQQQLDDMAARQEAIRRGLNDIAGKVGDRRDLLGRLDQLAKEMGDVAEDLRKNGLDDRVLERQNRILNRLLDAQKSIRKKDDREERESRTADQLAHASPGPLTREQMMGPDRLRRDILRGRADDYPAQFRSLVEKYFRALAERKAGAPGTGAPPAAGTPAAGAGGPR